MWSSKIFSRLSAISVVAIVTFAAANSALPQQQHAQRPKTLRLYIFDCGVIKSPKNPEMAVPCFLIAHPKGTLMWDVGSIPDTAFKDDGMPVTQGMFYSTRTLKSQLSEIGCAPSDITYLSLSHAHRDHDANSNEFAKATWLVRPEERDMLFAQKPTESDDGSEYSDLKNSKTVLITADEFDVFGDGKVIIKFAPGHTPGHSVLILKLAKTGNVLLTGDLWHYPDEVGTDHTLTKEYNMEQTVASRAMIWTMLRKQTRRCGSNTIKRRMPG